VQKRESEAAEARVVVLEKALERIMQLVSWCNHGEADRGETLDKIDEIASEAFRGTA
jgi:hypothetical protein